jgi:DNA recombination protein RmuC
MAFNLPVLLLALSACLGVFIYIYINSSNNLRSKIETHLTASEGRLIHTLHQSLLDISERSSKTGAELKDALTDRLERSMGINRHELQNGLAQTTKTLETKFQSLEQQVGLRLETIGKNVEAKLHENMKEGFLHFEKVQEHLKAAELKLASLNTVGQSISDLNQLLKLPHLRGGFGEATLERLLADFLPAGSFELQYTIVPGSAERVDAVVKLARQVLPIDSKFPREQVLPLFESQDPALLEDARKALSDFVKEQARHIAEKYIRPEHGTSDMALLFLPSETLYFEVIRNGKLFEHLSKLRVFPVSPNTLSIALKAVSIAQEYYELSRGVERTIEDVKKARKHFEHFERKFDDIGKGLKKAQEAFETANTHLGRYESSIFRLVGEKTDGTETAAALPAPEAEKPESVEETPRLL